MIRDRGGDLLTSLLSIKIQSHYIERQNNDIIVPIVCPHPLLPDICCIFRRFDAYSKQNSQSPNMRTPAVFILPGQNPNHHPAPPPPDKPKVPDPRKPQTPGGPRQSDYHRSSPQSANRQPA